MDEESREIKYRQEARRKYRLSARGRTNQVQQC